MAESMQFGPRTEYQTSLFDGINSQRNFAKDGIISELTPDMTPLLTFLLKTGKYSYTGDKDPDILYTEHRGSYLSRPKCYLGSALADFTSSAAGTVFSNINLYTTASGLTATGVIKAGMQVQLVTRSSAVDSTTQVATLYVKSAGTGTSWNLVLLSNAPGFVATETAGDTRSVLYVASNMYGVGSDMGFTRYEADSQKWAGTEIMKVPFSVTKSADAMRIKGRPGEYDVQLMRQMKNTKAEMERKLLYLCNRIGATKTDPFSAPDTAFVDADGNYIPTSTSILQTSNAAASLTGETRTFGLTVSGFGYDDWIDTTQNIFKYGTNKIAIGGAGMLSFLQKISNASPAQTTISKGQTSYGTGFKQIETAHGTLDFFKSELLTQDSKYTNTMFIIDPDNVELITYRDLNLEDLPTTKDIILKQWIAQIGLKIKYPERHGFAYLA